MRKFFIYTNEKYSHTMWSATYKFEIIIDFIINSWAIYYNGQMKRHGFYINIRQAFEDIMKNYNELEGK